MPDCAKVTSSPIPSGQPVHCCLNPAFQIRIFSAYSMYLQYYCGSGSKSCPIGISLAFQPNVKLNYSFLKGHFFFNIISQIGISLADPDPFQSNVKLN
jgi:hypothetical protein